MSMPFLLLLLLLLLTALTVYRALLTLTLTLTAAAAAATGLRGKFSVCGERKEETGVSVLADLEE